MTRDEILTMEAGRKMDALIAEKVFGYVRMHYPDENTWGERSYDDKFPSCDCFRQVPSRDYSTDIAAAWEVVEKFSHQATNELARKQGFSHWQLNSYPDSGWACRIGSLSAHADTAPLAICRAALLTTLEK
jgi:hypothetical protein